MKKVTFFLSLLCLVISGHSYAQELAGDAEHGEALFGHHCSTCHSLKENRIGPTLGGVFGRKAGSVAGFVYSKAVQASAVVWDAKTLDQWLENPQKFIPGQRMNILIPDAQKRADIIAYLKTATAK